MRCLQAQAAAVQPAQPWLRPQPHGAPQQHKQIVGSRARPPVARSAAAPQAAAPLPPPPQLLGSGAPPASPAEAAAQQQQQQQQQDYYIGVGAAVRALQQDLPALLDKQPNLDIFCEGVAFEDRLSPRLGLPPASCCGKEAYGRLMWSLRFHRGLFFRAARVELLRMWEREPGVVCVRWVARAQPRLLDGLMATSSGGGAMSLDGVSEFHFNSQGLISKHSVDCVQYSGMQLAVPLLARYAGVQRAMVPGLAGGSWDE